MEKNMGKTPTHLDPEHRPELKDRTCMNWGYWTQICQESRWIQLHPGDTPSKLGEIIDACEAGIKVKITRVVRQLSCGGYTPELGQVIFYPWAKLSYAYCTQSESEGRSVWGYGNKERCTWEQHVYWQSLEEDELSEADEV
jgi:hypothetical protein